MNPSIALMLQGALPFYAHIARIALMLQGALPFYAHIVFNNTEQKYHVNGKDYFIFMC